MSRKGGLSHKFYKETAGIKVTGGQVVKCGAVLTRQGDRWQPGLNVLGRTLLTAGCNGEVYFTRKRGHFKRAVTFVNIRPKAVKEKK